jgi:hypothetical protein
MGAGFGDTGEERCAAVVGGDVAWLDSTFESLVTGGRFGVGHASVRVHLGRWQNSRRYPFEAWGVIGRLYSSFSFLLLGINVGSYDVYCIREEMVAAMFGSCNTPIYKG